MKKKEKNIFLVHIDENGNMREEKDFENIMKFDSPAVVRALRKKLKK